MILLGLAIQLGETDVVKLLLELGSDENIANVFDGNHPLFILAKLTRQQNPKLITLAEILLDAGSDPLYEVHSQADNEKRIDATQTPSFNETALFCCIRYQNDDLLKTFIEYEVDINTHHGDTSTTPLMLAATLGYNHICHILLDAGAKINAIDYQGNTPLHLAIQHVKEENIDVIQTLIERGADLTASNEEGFTPTMLAAHIKNDACIKILNSQMAEKSPSHIYEELDDTKYQNVFHFV
jgi:ankyrin repeat protein